MEREDLKKTIWNSQVDPDQLALADEIEIVQPSEEPVLEFDNREQKLADISDRLKKILILGQPINPQGLIAESQQAGLSPSQVIDHLQNELEAEFENQLAKISLLRAKIYG